MTETRREFSARKQDISNFQTNRVCNCRKRNFCRRSIFFINFKMAGLKSKQRTMNVNFMVFTHWSLHIFGRRDETGQLGVVSQLAASYRS